MCPSESHRKYRSAYRSVIRRSCGVGTCSPRSRHPSPSAYSHPGRPRSLAHSFGLKLFVVRQLVSPSSSHLRTRQRSPQMLSCQVSFSLLLQPLPLSVPKHWTPSVPPIRLYVTLCACNLQNLAILEEQNTRYCA